MRRAHLLLLALLGACAAPTDTTPDQPMLGRTPAGPTVTSADPPGARQDTTLDVHVLGSGFDRGSKVEFLRDGVVDAKLHVNGTTYRTSSELVANVTVAADAATVSYDVMVTTASGKKGIGTELFVVEVPFETLQAPAGFSDVYDVSPTGTISGRVSTSCGPGWTPVLWDLNRALIPLPTLPGTCGGVATAVNGSGIAAGSASSAGGDKSVRWLPGASGYTAEELPTLPGGSDAGAWSLNESGTIGAGNEAAVWTGGSQWQLLTKPSGAGSCVATRMGNGGQVVGHCLVAGVSRGVFWASPSSAPVVLPTPAGGTGASTWGVSASSVVVGVVTGVGAVRWVPSGTSWTVERLADLGNGASALAVNDAGYVAGSVIYHNSDRPAFWTPVGALHLLSTGNRPGEAVGLSEPDHGLIIAGYYSVKGNKTAIRWKP